MSLWNHVSSKSIFRSPQNTPNKNILTQETSPYTCRKGSITVECAVVIPWAAGFLACFVFLFRVLQVQVSVEEALLYAGREVAVESSITKEETLLFLSAEGFLLYALEDEPVVSRYVKHGIWGVSLLGSSFDGEYICLQANYKMPLPVSFFGIKEIELESKNLFAKWQGGQGWKDDNDAYVYITPTGEVYHATRDCRSIRIDVKEAMLSEIEGLRGANGQKYYACSFCRKGEGIKVYYTDYGTLYHFEIGCSSLKRTVERVLLSTVSGRRPCKFCVESE